MGPNAAVPTRRPPTVRMVGNRTSSHPVPRANSAQPSAHGHLIIQEIYGDKWWPRAVRAPLTRLSGACGRQAASCLSRNGFRRLFRQSGGSKAIQRAPRIEWSSRHPRPHNPGLHCRPRHPIRISRRRPRSRKENSEDRAANTHDKTRPPPPPANLLRPRRNLARPPRPTAYKPMLPGSGTTISKLSASAPDPQPQIKLEPFTSPSEANVALSQVSVSASGAPET
jgi:hypothetical protein